LTGSACANFALAQIPFLGSGRREAILLRCAQGNPAVTFGEELSQNRRVVVVEALWRKLNAARIAQLPGNAGNSSRDP
jgi:hypothetical protein